MQTEEKDERVENWVQLNQLTLWSVEQQFAEPWRIATEKTEQSTESEMKQNEKTMFLQERLVAFHQK